MVKQIPSSQSQVRVEPVKDRKLEQARMTDVMLLLETVLIREEATVKQILDCLYDIGSVNLIDQRIQVRFLNRLAKWIARFSKPIFRIVALRWCKQNCPRLITKWLYTQVKFEPQQIAQVVEAVEEVGKVGAVGKTGAAGEARAAEKLGETGATEAIETADAAKAVPVYPETTYPEVTYPETTYPETTVYPIPTPELDFYRQKVLLLHGRIRLLTTLLVGITVALGTGLIWSLGRHQMQTSQFESLIQSRWPDQTAPCVRPMLQLCP